LNVIFCIILSEFSYKVCAYHHYVVSLYQSLVGLCDKGHHNKHIFAT